MADAFNKRCESVKPFAVHILFSAHAAFAFATEKQLNSGNVQKIHEAYAIRW